MRKVVVREIKVDGKIYSVNIIYKDNKYIHYRYRDGAFYITSPKFVSEKRILSGLDKYSHKLIAKAMAEDAIGDGYMMLLGKRIPIYDSGVISFSDNSEITYKNKEELDKKLRKFFLHICESRVEHYTKIMGVALYKTRIRKMNTRYGSNSLTSRTVCFATKLMHYSLEIIDSVIIHELAHIKVFNHSKKFYDFVYKYCPNYDELHTKLRKGIYL